jgi:hypothetical protein
VRVLTHYKHDFEDMQTALDHLKAHRRVQDVEIKTGSNDLVFSGDMVSVGGEQPIKMSAPFLRAFCDRMEPHLPIRYASKVPADLFEMNANRLLAMNKNKGQKLTVRIEDWLNDEGGVQTRTAQSLVTEAYQFIDHEDVLERAIAVNGRIGGGSVVITDELLRVNAIAAEFSITNPRGEADHFKLGYDLVNSETRTSRLAVSSFLLRLICTNGAVAPVPGFGDSYRKRHVVDPDEALDEVAKILAAIEWTEEAVGFQSRLQDMVGKSVSRETMWRYRLAAEDVAGSELTREFWEEQGWPEQVTEFDVFNRMTRIARDLKDDRKRELEAVAGTAFLKGIEAVGTR